MAGCILSKTQPDVVDRLRELMQERKLTTTALARQTRLSQQTISSILTGTRSITLDTLVELSYALNVPADYLLGIAPAKNREELNALEKRLARLLTELKSVEREKLAADALDPEYKKLREKENALVRDIERLKISIERSKQFPLKLPTIPEDYSAVYEPLPNAPADIAVVAQRGSDFPPDTVLFVCQNKGRAFDGAVFVDKAANVTDSDLAAGYVSYALIPGRALKEFLQRS